MKFRQVTASRYIGSNGYELRKLKDNTFVICLNSSVTKWGTGFQSIKAAESFINAHNYIKASTSSMPISADDAQFIIEMYTDGTSSKLNRTTSVYEINPIYSVSIKSLPDSNDFAVDLYKNGRIEQEFVDMDAALPAIDNISDNRILSSIYRGAELRPILAAKGRSARDITRNLVRVRSSNVWAYGIEMKDKKVGDVYVQFKGKNGGPDDIYCYYDVPVAVWQKILSHPSKGHAVWKYLRNNFLYRKLTGDKRGKLKNAVN